MSSAVKGHLGRLHMGQHREMDWQNGIGRKKSHVVTLFQSFVTAESGFGP